MGLAQRQWSMSRKRAHQGTKDFRQQIDPRSHSLWETRVPASSFLPDSWHFLETLQPAVGLCWSWQLLTLLKSAEMLSWTKISKTHSNVSKKLKWESTLWWILNPISKITRSHFQIFCISLSAFGTHLCLSTVYFYNSTAMHNCEEYYLLERNVLASQWTLRGERRYNTRHCEGLESLPPTVQFGVKKHIQMYLKLWMRSKQQFQKPKGEEHKTSILLRKHWVKDQSIHLGMGMTFKDKRRIPHKAAY